MKIDVTDMKRDYETVKTALSDLLIDNPELQSNLNNLQVNYKTMLSFYRMIDMLSVTFIIILMVQLYTSLVQDQAAKVL